jgi:RNA polymerase sigma factor (sigma-70 family)
MANSDWEQAIARIRELVLAGDISGISDGSLLRLFVAGRDEAAFEAIVRRHASMIMGVCQRVLANPSDVEDAFQATFLILVRKAGTLAEPDLLANWLYGVAYRTARTARGAARRRRAKEQQVMPRQAPLNSSNLQDLLPILDEELNRLPAKYRAPFVLCDLEQKSRKEAGQALGLMEGTLASRLARARSMLANRLSRRGVTLSVATLTVAMGEATEAASPTLLQETIRAALLLMVGQTAELNLTSTAALKLSEAAMKTMLLTKVWTMGALLVGGLLLSAGAGTLIDQHLRSGPTFLIGSAGSSQKQQLKDEMSAAALLESALAAAAEVIDSPAKVNLLMRIANAQLDAGDRTGARSTAQKALVIAENWPPSRDMVAELVKVATLQDRAGQKKESRQTTNKALDACFGIATTEGQGKTVSLSLVIGLLAKWGEYDQCLRIASEREAVEGNVIGMMARVIAFKYESKPAALKALNRGTELVRERISKKPNEAAGFWMHQGDSTIQALAGAYARLGDMPKAMQLNELLKIRKATGSEYKANALPFIAYSQVQAGDFRAALETISKIDAPPHLKEFNRINILRRIADKQIDLGDLADATKTASELTNRQDRAEVLHTIALVQLEKGDRKGALATLEQIRQLSKPAPANERKEIDGSNLNSSAPEVLQADLEARLGDFEGAQRTAAKLTAAKQKAQAFCDIGSQYLSAKKLEEARQILRRASRSAERVPSEPPRYGAGPGTRRPRFSFAVEKSVLLRRIAGFQARAGDVEGAMETAESLDSGAPLYWIVIARAKAGDIKGAIESFSILKDSDDKAIALEQLAGMMADGGDKTGALALAAKQDTPLLKAYTLLGIALGYEQRSSFPMHPNEGP